MLKSLLAGPSWIRTRAWPGVKTVLSTGKYATTAILLGLIFLGLYLFSIQHIVYFSSVDLSFQAAITSVRFVSSWTEKIFKVRAPFIWERLTGEKRSNPVFLFQF